MQNCLLKIWYFQITGDQWQIDFLFHVYLGYPTNSPILLSLPFSHHPRYFRPSADQRAEKPGYCQGGEEGLSSWALDGRERKALPPCCHQEEGVRAVAWLHWIPSQPRAICPSSTASSVLSTASGLHPSGEIETLKYGQELLSLGARGASAILFRLRELYHAAQVVSVLCKDCDSLQ